VRELNDEINKLNKTKSYWDARIVELGGGDASKGRKFYDVEGVSISIYILLIFKRTIFPYSINKFCSLCVEKN
jgi:Isy1-like splicing family